MEFIAGILFTLFAEWIGWNIYKAREQRKACEAYIPPRRVDPAKDYYETDKQP